MLFETISADAILATRRSRLILAPLTIFFRTVGVRMDIARWRLDELCQNVLGLLPPESSLIAITICAVLYGVACWMTSKCVLAALHAMQIVVAQSVRRVFRRPAY